MEVEVVQETPLTPHSEHSYSKVSENVASTLVPQTNFSVHALWTCQMGTSSGMTGAS